MALLESTVYNNVVEEGKKAVTALKSNDIDGFLDYAEKGWAYFPEPKDSWNQGYNYAKMVFKGAIDHKRFDSAKVWLNRMIDNNNTLHSSDTEVWFNLGKYLYETGDHQGAYERWKVVVDEAGLRYFESEKPAYLEFFKTAQKQK